MKVKSGMLFENEDANIFIKYVTSNTVKFIEWVSPSAIHNIQEMPIENFLQYINKWGFTQTGYWK